MYTPIKVTDGNIAAKLELFNPSGSHKYRAAQQIIANGLEDGSITPGRTTVIEKTGGNFGVSGDSILNSVSSLHPGNPAKN